jgi:hypothetical protein
MPSWLKNGISGNYRLGRRDGTQSTVHHYGRGFGDRAHAREKENEAPFTSKCAAPA